MTEVAFPKAVAFDYAECAMTKAQALKVLEEAAELVEAVKDYVAADCDDYEQLLHCEVRALDEAMDVYQALANLLAGEFTDDEIARVYECCVERNRVRGRL